MKKVGDIAFSLRGHFTFVSRKKVNILQIIREGFTSLNKIGSTPIKVAIQFVKMLKLTINIVVAFNCEITLNWRVSSVKLSKASRIWREKKKKAKSF